VGWRLRKRLEQKQEMRVLLEGQLRKAFAGSLRRKGMVGGTQGEIQSVKEGLAVGGGLVRGNEKETRSSRRDKSMPWKHKSMAKGEDSKPDDKDEKSCLE